MRLTEFKTKTKLYEYTNSHINQIGECESLKSKNKEFFDFCVELFKKHPNYPEKVKDLADIKITRNTLNKTCFQLNIVREDSTVEDISYRNCIYSQKSNHLNEAFRVAIFPDILEFKNMSEHICANKDCKSKNNINYDVDHVNYFEKLVRDFMKDRTEYPSIFSETKHNQRCFRPEDSQFEREWILFHRQNAVLQILCHTCNLKRKKWSKL